MRDYSFVFLLFCGYVLGNTINNIRLIDHTSYVADMIQKTIEAVEEREWCNLKLPDVEQKFHEDVITSNVSGTVKYQNGFVTAIQFMDIEQSSVQQVWFHDRVANITTLSVRGRLRMFGVKVGYDVIAELNDGDHRYTAEFLHPMISFLFSVIQDVNKDEGLTMKVEGTVPNTIAANRPSLTPMDHTSSVITIMYNFQSLTSAGMLAWGPEVFEPIARDLIENKLKFPTICYNCPA
ncbi:uncharacterized protein LOC113504822 [Trichoplusia ni]|uniref:Uncharacterized protein LOC113504822 n=1 Tax=Trichoplusia ni TaxID=7111 RepID=A0A7E5WR21_TRINI|nr:uncharacterized protein LOC113504822 [Trichoplusia ni]